MPVRVIGMIGVTPPSGEATVHIIKGGISAPYLRSYAQAHDKAGFDLALVGYTASSAEGKSPRATCALIHAICSAVSVIVMGSYIASTPQTRQTAAVDLCVAVNW